MYSYDSTDMKWEFGGQANVLGSRMDDSWMMF